MATADFDRKADQCPHDNNVGPPEDLVALIVREASVTETQARQIIERYGDEDPEKLVNYALHLIEDSEPRPGSDAGKV